VAALVVVAAAAVASADRPQNGDFTRVAELSP
jgi:hypothetical protein